MPVEVVAQGVPKIKKQVKTEKKEKRIKPALAGGFLDYGPRDAIIKQRILEKIKKTFEDFGFDPMETPAVERTEVLTGGEKTAGKIIFNVRSSAQQENKIRDDLSLRFDLTVPLARFVAANPDIPKPLKRYQVGNIWRGERPQAGRYREFLQADIDIVGASSPEADSEIITVIYRVFKNLGINRFLIKINNRKILNGLPKFAGFPEKKLFEVLRTIDKLDKIGEPAANKELKKLVGGKAQGKISEFLKISGDTKNKLLKVRELFNGIAIAEEGIKELVEIARNLNTYGVDEKNWQLNLSTVRGLGYYSGPVFETYLNDLTEFGGMFQGGRYDNLVMSFTGQKIPAVGASIGVDRLFAALDKLGLLKRKATLVKILILNMAPELKNDYISFAKNLREANINTEIYLGDDRTFQAQLAYAVKKEIPYVIIYGEQERKKGALTVKNLVSREQKEIAKENLVSFFKK